MAEEIRDVYGANDYKAKLLNEGEDTVFVTLKNDEGIVVFTTATMTKEFETAKEVELALKTLQIAGYKVVAGVDPVKWIGTLLRSPDYKEIVNIKLTPGD